jgi:phosphoenolpyruvate carboxykinase (GTP)
MGEKERMSAATNRTLNAWVEECERLCRPDQVVWCDGSEAERARLTAEAVSAGDLIPLDPGRLPGCHLHRSAINDVARTEKLTFICSRNQIDAGPTNNWMAPREAYDKLRGLFEGAMRGRTMYVVPFLMGPKGSPFSKVGVEITDSIYVALNMGLMTRMGSVALEHLGASDDFTRGLHSKADLNEGRRFICHFPEDNTIWSVGSGYGGNALLSKKCLALRLASVLGSKEGWLAEHMLIVGVEDPQGHVTYLCGAFPSACGKTNLAMLVPPERFKGWRVWTVGDDIAWLRPGEDGRLYAVNPEAGFFGVAPGTSRNSNPNALAMVQRDAIFTNVALKGDNTVYWEGLEEPPAQCTDWRGQPWVRGAKEPAAHPNARFTVSIRQSPTYTDEWNNPKGVPISAIVFGARRANVVPLIYEALSWQHGTYLGATMASETTAAATGAVGVVRRDPFAMLPFCGYHMGDYFGHWLEVGRQLTHPPKIFRVNWFNRDESGKFIWPGFGDNLRVLQWIIERCRDRGAVRETAIGLMPSPDAIDTEGLRLPAGAMDRLLAVDHEGWTRALRGQEEFFTQLAPRLPQGMQDEHNALKKRLKSTRAPARAGA